MDGVRPVRVSASGLQRGSRPHMSGDVRRSPADSFWKEAKPRAEGNQGSERLQGRRLDKRGLPRQRALPCAAGPFKYSAGY